MIQWRPRVRARNLGFPEGPVWLGNGMLAFTEIRGQCVSLLEGDTYRVLAKTGGGANGAALGPDGALYVANNGGLSVGPGGYWFAAEPIDGKIQRVTLGGEVEDLVTSFPGDGPHRPNDLCFGPDGMLYVTDPANWEDLKNLKPGRIWRVDVVARTAEQVAEVPMFVNGIAFGPDGRLYAAQSLLMKIVAFEWSPAGLGEPRDFATLPKGFPDGFCFTDDGRLIACGSMGDVIQVFDAAGTLVQTIETGEHTEPTNCCVGDGELHVTMAGTGEVVSVPLAS